jgi:chromosome segregation ATPase
MDDGHWTLFADTADGETVKMKYEINERQIGTLTSSLDTILDADSLDTLDADALVAIMQITRTLTAIQTDAQRQRHMDIQADSRRALDEQRQRFMERQNETIREYESRIATLKDNAHTVAHEYSETLAHVRTLNARIERLTAPDADADDTDDDAPSEDFAELMAAGLVPARGFEADHA